jgi:hypothetical protein
MAANDDFKQYPRGNVAMDNGDLIDVTDVKDTFKRANKIKHTLRKEAAGKVKGPLEGEVSFDAIVSEDGAERDYLALLISGKIKKLRLKVPGETITVVGTVDERSREMPLEDAIKYSIKFSGRLVV